MLLLFRQNKESTACVVISQGKATNMKERKKTDGNQILKQTLCGKLLEGRGSRGGAKLS